MLTESEYARQSIELNLFFLRIMKEHLLHVVVSLIKKEPSTVQFLLNMMGKFEKLLTQTILLAYGVVGPQTLAAGDIITQYTYQAELVTQNYIGWPINTGITRMEAALINSTPHEPNPMIEQSVNILNQQIIGLLGDNIQAQKKIIDNFLSCKMFLTTYPMLLQHITQESGYYQMQLQTLQNRQSLIDDTKRAAMNEVYWNRKMAEHARIGYGLLDPVEEALIQEAKIFSAQFDELTEAAREAYERPQSLPKVTRRSMEATTNIRNWKERITIGLLECKVKSRMPPMIAEHVMREANHFLKDLRAIDMKS